MPSSFYTVNARFPGLPRCVTQALATLTRTHLQLRVTKSLASTIVARRSHLQLVDKHRALSDLVLSLAHSSHDDGPTPFTR